MKFAYYHAHHFVYRVRRGQQINWQEPTGGIVCDRELGLKEVMAIAHVRYHTGPGEDLILAKAGSEHEKWEADLLQQSWNREVMEFRKLMMEA